MLEHMHHINMSSVTFASYNQLIVVAFFVFAFSLSVVVHRSFRRVFDTTFWFALAITVSWFGTDGTRIWFSVWKYMKIKGYDVSWMENHWFLVFLISCISVGGMMHLRTLTKPKYGEKLWLSITGLSACVFIASLFI